MRFLRAKNGRLLYDLCSAKGSALGLKRNSPKTIEFHALRSYCKEGFIKDLQLTNWASTLEPMCDSLNKVALPFHATFEKLLNMSP